jgi:hypothetical protein
MECAIGKEHGTVPPFAVVNFLRPFLDKRLVDGLIGGQRNWLASIICTATHRLASVFHVL